MAIQDLEKYNPGDMLKEADLGSYISSMGLGVAEAQKALDDNSMAQLVELSQPVAALKGKSLIQLGLLPAFYHFRKATLTASVSMSLKVSESLSIGGSLSVKSEGNIDKTVTKTSTKRHVLAHTIKINNSIEVTSTASSSDNAIERISGYTQHLISGETVISNRAELAAGAAFSSNQLVGWSSEGAMFAVPPAGQGWQVWKFTGGILATDNFPVKSTTGWSGQAKSDASSAAAWLEGKALTEGLWAFAFPGKFKVEFDFARSVIKKSEEAKLRVIANLIANSNLAGVKLIGRTDKVGNEAANLVLGADRASAIKASLIAFGAPSTAFVVSSDGEANAQIAENANDNTRAPDRHVEIDILSSDWLVLISGLSVLGSATAIQMATYERIAQGSYPSDGKKAPGDESVTNAELLAAQFDGHTQYEASYAADSEIVYLSNKENLDVDVYDIEIWDANNSKLAINSISSSSDITEDVLTAEETKSLVKKKNRTTAFALSIDARYAKSFDLSMAGNMSVSAELVSVPPPQEFIEFVRKTWEE
jgi:outer membrane protein OmpA-like peptidoglycan-associated protein